MKCAVKRCRNIMMLTWYGVPVCDEHWHRHCDDSESFDLRKLFPNVVKREEESYYGNSNTDSEENVEGSGESRT